MSLVVISTPFPAINKRVAVRNPDIRPEAAIAGMTGVNIFETVCNMLFPKPSLLSLPCLSSFSIIPIISS